MSLRKPKKKQPDRPNIGNNRVEGKSYDKHSKIEVVRIYMLLLASRSITICKILAQLIVAATATRPASTSDKKKLPPAV